MLVLKRVTRGQYDVEERLELTDPLAALREHGTPLMPSDLAHHAMIISRAHLSPTFSFRQDERVASVLVQSQLAVTIAEGGNALFVSGKTIKPAAPIHGIPRRGDSTQTKRRIPPGYGYDSFTRMAPEFTQ
ncbi:hypothetical protein [Allomesorhizobium camelthorni]|uniref:Uncharacterized protein n=1 Tax=Allomesorhizobium camelthorni TaxID=475069 RepID=A0A6G4WMT6_9HYPH|nr:hypothetical protein [Mesorhizobium camelthorni]NGO56135.1 hypothetical protein [Mesorhizobium camelthorni]